jgi:CrcB protein
MSIYIALALAGAVGAISRYWVLRTTYSWLGDNFPYGTLMVNVSGSLVMGFLTVLLVHRFNVSQEIRLALLVGFLGSFTTFSTFSMDAVHWLENGAPLKALIYVLLSVVACVLGAWGGLISARHIFLR